MEFRQENSPHFRYMNINLPLLHDKLADLEISLKSLVELFQSGVDFDKELFEKYTEEHLFEADYLDLKVYLRCIQELQKTEKVDELCSGENLAFKANPSNLLLQYSIETMQKINAIDSILEFLLLPYNIEDRKAYRFTPENQQPFSKLKSQIDQLAETMKPETDEAIEATWLFFWNFLRLLSVLSSGQLNVRYVLSCLEKNLKSEDITHKISKIYPENIQLISSLILLIKKNENDSLPEIYNANQQNLRPSKKAFNIMEFNSTGGPADKSPFFADNRRESTDENKGSKEEGMSPQYR